MINRTNGKFPTTSLSFGKATNQQATGASRPDFQHQVPMRLPNLTEDKVELGTNGIKAPNINKKFHNEGTVRFGSELVPASDVQAAPKNADKGLVTRLAHLDLTDPERAQRVRKDLEETEKGHPSTVNRTSRDRPSEMAKNHPEYKKQAKRLQLLETLATRKETAAATASTQASDAKQAIQTAKDKEEEAGVISEKKSK